MAIPFPNIHPIAFQIGPFPVRWYGIAYFLGFILCWRYGLYLSRRIQSDPRINVKPIDVEDFLIWSVIGVIVGGRLGYALFYQPNLFISPLDLLSTWKGGMSFHGGFLGMVFALWGFSHMRKISMMQIADLASVTLPIGLFLGRLANFINQELNGKMTDVPWAVIFATGGNVPRHPSQLYEAGLEGICLFLIMAIGFFKFDLWKKPGTLTGLFICFYAIFRVIVEFFREPDNHIGYIYDTFTLGQIYSIPMFLLGLGVLYFSHRAQAK